jgi:uncharacterized protein YdaU (DUF1376 family)
MNDTHAQYTTRRELDALEAAWRNADDKEKREEARRRFHQAKAALTPTTAAAPEKAVANFIQPAAAQGTAAAVPTSEASVAAQSETVTGTNSETWQKRANQRNKLPWLKFYIGDFFEDYRVDDLKEYQVSWLLRLMAAAWRTGGWLPNDPKAMARLARAKRPRVFLAEIDAVKQFFEVEGECLFHPYLRQCCEDKMDTATKGKRASASGTTLPSATIQ